MGHSVLRKSNSYAGGARAPMTCRLSRHSALSMSITASGPASAMRSASWSAGTHGRHSQSAHIIFAWTTGETTTQRHQKNCMLLDMANTLEGQVGCHRCSTGRILREFVGRCDISIHLHMTQAQSPHKSSQPDRAASAAAHRHTRAEAGHFPPGRRRSAHLGAGVADPGAGQSAY